MIMRFIQFGNRNTRAGGKGWRKIGGGGDVLGSTTPLDNIYKIYWKSMELKYFAIYDSAMSFPLNGEIYLGEQPNAQRNQSR